MKKSRILFLVNLLILSNAQLFASSDIYHDRYIESRSISPRSRSPQSNRLSALPSSDVVPVRMNPPLNRQSKVNVGCACCAKEIEQVLHTAANGIKIISKGGQIIIKGLTEAHLGNTEILNQIGTIFSLLNVSASILE